METVLIRRFSDSRIQAAIDHALEVLDREEPGKTIALVAHVDLDGATLTAVGKIGDNWSLSGSVSKPWHGPLAAEAEVIVSF